MSDCRFNRQFTRCPNLSDAMTESDQSRGVEHPRHGKPEQSELIELPAFEGAVMRPQYADLLDLRRSVRVFANTPLMLGQLAFMLWSAQGVQAYRGADRVAVLRTVPSGGARHPFELYFAARLHRKGSRNGVIRRRTDDINDDHIKNPKPVGGFGG